MKNTGKMKWIILSLTLILSFFVLKPYSLGQDVQEEMNSYFSNLNMDNSQEYWTKVSQLKEYCVKNKKMASSLLLAKLSSTDPSVVLAASNALYAIDIKGNAILFLTKLLKMSEVSDLRKIVIANQISALVEGDVGYGDRDKLNSDLKEISKNTDNIELKLSLAGARYHIAGALQPKREIKEIFNMTNNINYKRKAAILLAQMGAYYDVMDVLKAMSKEPTPEGTIAKELLAKKEMIDNINRQYLPKDDPRYNLLNEVIDKLKKYYVDPDKISEKSLITAATKGVASSLDPFTSYLDEEEYKKLLQTFNESYSGIGAGVSMKDDVLQIERTFFNGPAYKAGLRAYDKVIEVDGKSIIGKPLDIIVSMLKGPENTPVILKVIRRGWTEAKKITIVRKKINLDTVKWDMMPGNIGYIQISAFSKKTHIEMNDALKDLKEKGMVSLVVDVRNNPGGLLDTVVAVVDYFVESNQVVVTTKGRGGSVLDVKKTKLDDKIDIPLYVLINGNSASAAEIFSGCMQDYARNKLIDATLVGERTYGKGSVQRPFGLESTNNTTIIKITIAKYYLPSGRCIHKDRGIERDASTPDPDEDASWGVKPDIEVKMPEREFWVDFEIEKILGSDAPEKYVAELLKDNLDMMTLLADNDFADDTKYPKFDEFYNSLNTHVDKNEVRLVIRSILRKKIAEKRGKEYLFDVQRDVQLQRAVWEILKKLNIDPNSIADYKYLHLDQSEKEKKTDVSNDNKETEKKTENTPVNSEVK